MTLTLTLTLGQVDPQTTDHEPAVAQIWVTGHFICSTSSEQTATSEAFDRRFWSV